MDLKNARKHSTDILFVLLLFLVFTSSALAVILLGAKVYQNTASRMESNYTVRTALAYVTEKIRHADESGAISPGELDELPALILSQEIEGTSLFCPGRGCEWRSAFCLYPTQNGGGQWQCMREKAAPVCF